MVNWKRGDDDIDNDGDDDGDDDGDNDGDYYLLNFNNNDLFLAKHKQLSG